MAASTSGWLVALAAACAFGCGSKREPAKDKPTPPSPGDAAAVVATDAAVETDADLTWYRIQAKVEDLGLVPFVIGIHKTRPDGVIWSANERLPLVVLQREPLRLRIPVRGIELTLAPEPGGGGALRGEWGAMYYFKQDFPIVAEPIAAPRADLLFPGSEAPAFDLAGAWRLDIADFGISRGSFQQTADGTITGTIIPPEIGDLRHLTGRVIGDMARMSTFDGTHGFYIEMKSTGGGDKLTGSWLIAGIGKFAVTATRDEAPATHVKVSARMAPGKTRITLPELSRPEFAGKPVIVDYFGSWCPVCIDLTPELVRLQKQHAAVGLQVLSIALEPPGDEAETKRRLDEFRATFGMSWPFDIKYTDDFNGAVPKEILDATGFPITIFLRRDHTVSAVHTGFISRAAGPEHDAVVKLLEKYAAEIVAPPPAQGSAGSK